MHRFLWAFITSGVLFSGAAVAGEPPSGSTSGQFSILSYFAEQALANDSVNPDLALLCADSLAKGSRESDNLYWLSEAYKLKGDINRYQGEYNQSLYWLREALTAAEEAKDTLSIVRVSNNFGLLYYNTGKFDKALDKLSLSLLLGKELLSLPQKATIISHLGQIHEALEQFDEALAFYQQSLAILQKEKDVDLLLGMVYNNLGSLYAKLQKKEEALSYYRQARKLYEKEDSEKGIGQALNGIALIYSQDNPEIAIEYLRLAKKLFLKNHNLEDLYQFNKNAGSAYTALQEPEHAFIHFKLALEKADSLGNDFYRSQVLLNIARLFEQQQDYDEATKFYKEYVRVKSDLYNKELVENIASTRAAYELDIKEHQIQNLEEEADQRTTELRYRNYTLWLLILLSLLTLSFGAIFVLKYRKSVRINRLLTARNKEVETQKEELKNQHDIILQKGKELEKARQLNEQVNEELIASKERLEEKVKERTKELEETYRRLSFHIYNTPLVVLEWNRHRELIHWPLQAEVIFGYTADEMLGLRMEEMPYLLPEDSSQIVETIDQLCKGDASQSYFTKLNTDRFGNKLFVEWSYSVNLNEEGELESILSIANDVSQREQTYRELKNANQELDTFLYKSSHDLRGPIARMQGIINLGLLETKDPNAHLYFNMLNKVTDELNNLLLRLLNVHNINQHDYRAEELPLRKFIDNLETSHRKRKQEPYSVQIVNKVPEDLSIVADRTLLQIILVNLLENGLMYSDNFNPYIEFDAVYLPSGKYIVTVSDNGMGIPEQFREKVFDMFFQGSTRSTGTGLGLYMVRKATKKLGGDICLNSVNGLTVFEISLPAAKAARQEELVKV
ncbi:tetratricopeptide repeat protein [Nafulsella turpanensis]|uniref:tetratricopeptide repeat protein n=1 Tax=Nafulsella turpanensis TaxID=1265690 RepID=UPI00034B73AA|nr:tetratricopeptide repeat protein [Nafulsella turpanensis]